MSITTHVTLVLTSIVIALFPVDANALTVQELNSRPYGDVELGIVGDPDWGGSLAVDAGFVAKQLSDGLGITVNGGPEFHRHSASMSGGWAGYLTLGAGMVWRTDVSTNNTRGVIGSVDVGVRYAISLGDLDVTVPDYLGGGSSSIDLTNFWSAQIGTDAYFSDVLGLPALGFGFFLSFDLSQDELRGFREYDDSVVNRSTLGVRIALVNGR